MTHLPSPEKQVCLSVCVFFLNLTHQTTVKNREQQIVNLLRLHPGGPLTMQWWSLFVMCFSHLSILLKHFSVLKMRHVEKYSKTGILNFNARHNITPDKGQKMCTFPQMLCFSYLHNLIYPCWHCSWSIIINVAPGPSRYLTNHVFFVFFTS